MMHAQRCAEATVLTHILQDKVTLAAWQREANAPIQAELASSNAGDTWRDVRVACKPDAMKDVLNDHWGQAYPSLQADICLVTDMFACLFDANEVAIRIVRLTRAMCPRFHTDKIPCRLVTTYQGAGTEWLGNESIQRDFLGRGANGKPDKVSGLIKPNAVIQQLAPFDVAILKGDAWPGNEGLGLVHRSPECDENQPRVIMTLDYAG